MSVTSDNKHGLVTILDKLRASERRVAELNAQLASTRADLAAERRSSENRQQDLDIERTNATSLHQALDSLQVSKPFGCIFSVFFALLFADGLKAFL